MGVGREGAAAQHLTRGGRPVPPAPLHPPLLTPQGQLGCYLEAHQAALHAWRLPGKGGELAGAPGQPAAGAAVEVRDDVELLQALRAGARDIVLRAHVRLGRAWRELAAPVAVRGNTTIRSALGAIQQLGTAPLLDLGLVRGAIDMRDGASLRLEGLELMRWQVGRPRVGARACVCRDRQTY